MLLDGPWLASLDSYDTFGVVVGTVMITIAAAQWLASRFAERAALRLFALRYLLAGIGWFTAHPQAQAQGTAVPWVSVLVGVGLQALTIHALDVYLAQHSRRRLLGLLAVVAAALALLWALNRTDPDNAWGIMGVTMLSTAWCALQAARAARRERNVGHAWVAAAFASYPVLTVVALILIGQPDGDHDLSYLLALPAGLVGIAILVVSLIRAVKRTQDALATREAARAALHEMNLTLEQRVAERTRELRAMVDGLESFNRQVSHDLRGPLAGVSGLARLAADALRKGAARDVPAHLDVLARQCERLQTMVADLLTLSRVAQADLSPAPQPMLALLDQALDQLRLAPGGDELFASVDLRVGALPSVPADAALVRQVWVNLLGNALRFAAARHADGGGRGEVHIGASAHAGATAFFVADNGPGFPAERADDLFKPFSRLHDGELSQNGVGLSIVQRAVERHGGRAWAESTPGRGATFWFTLADAPA